MLDLDQLGVIAERMRGYNDSKKHCLRVVEQRDARWSW